MRGRDLIDELVKRFPKRSDTKPITDAELSRELGMTQGALSQWKSRDNLTARQIVNLALTIRQRAQVEALTDAVRSIVEFFEIDETRSRQGTKWEIFSPRDVAETSHKAYLSDIKKRLSTSRGIYVFYDSRGRAIYVGKTTRQYLWKEINLAFNRHRGAVQSIRRVRHANHQSHFDPASDSLRPIKITQVALHELAAYFSAYEITAPLIGTVEALLVRAFANDLLNAKMESLAPKSPDKNTA